MRVFGYEIQRSAPELAVAGTGFEARSILASRAVARRQDTTAPMLLDATPGNSGLTNLEERRIQSDPRELWYLALPNKVTPQQCLNILRAALGGDLWQQWQLLSLMLDTWPKFRMAAHQLREAAAYTTYAVHPYAEEGAEPTPEAIEKATLVSRALKGMNPAPFGDERGCSGMIYDFTDAMLNGLGLSELVWEKRKTKKWGIETLPRAAAWIHPRHFTFSVKGEVCVTDDGYSRLYSDPRTHGTQRLGESPDPDKFICSQFMSRSGSSLGAGFMRPLVWYWAARQFNNEWMLNTAKQFGAPFIDVTYKPGKSGEAEREQLAAFLKDAGALRRLLHPEGTVAQIHPAQSMGSENPQRYIATEADNAALFLLLGQEGTTNATPGKLGDSSTHADVKEERVLGLASWVAASPLRQFARAVLRVNYGNDDECPNIKPDRTRPLSSTEAGGFLTSVTNSRIPARADEIYKKVGLTQPQPGDMILESGKIVIMSEPVTQDELRTMEQEAMAYEAAVNAQASAQASQPKDTVAHVIKGSDSWLKTFRASLLTARDADLDDLEAAVVKAEQAAAAGHVNGEWEAVKVICNKRIQVL